VAAVTTQRTCCEFVPLYAQATSYSWQKPPPEVSQGTDPPRCILMFRPTRDSALVMTCNRLRCGKRRCPCRSLDHATPDPRSTPTTASLVKCRLGAVSASDQRNHPLFRGTGHGDTAPVRKLGTKTADLMGKREAGWMNFRNAPFFRDLESALSVTSRPRPAPWPKHPLKEIVGRKSRAR